MYSISFQEDSLLPRERLAKEGVEALSNQELLAILLRTGTRQASVFEIAQKVLNNLSSLTDLLYLNTQNQIIHQQTIFIGSATRSIAEPREILHYAIKHMATSLILVHNHPSGAVAPSRNDNHVTKLVKEACDLMGIVLLDHLIVSHSNYFSYREKTDLI